MDDARRARYFSWSSATTPSYLTGYPPLELPPLSLSTDSNGNIVNYFMGGLPTEILGISGLPAANILNPPLSDPEAPIPVAAALLIDFQAPTEWNAITDVPGQWTLVTPGGTTTTPTLSVSPSSLNLSAVVGAASAQNTLRIGSSGGTVSWTATLSILNGSGWLTISPASGTVSGVQQSTLTVNVNYGAMGAAGLYQAVIAVKDTGSGRTVSIPVAVTLIAQQSQIGVSAPLFQFS